MNKKNKNPFKTPEGYFDSFQDHLMEMVSKDGSTIPKERGFIVPDNYFEAFNEKVTGKLKDETKVVQLYAMDKMIAIVASIAAAIVIVFLGANSNTGKSINFNDLANTEIESYFENNELGLSSYEISEFIPVSNTEISDILNSSISDENILDYLNENINDFEELNIQDNE
ncbi:hypothetical protein ACNR9Q_14025 [Maribacter sp. X9]|uniref:hypothetical protein n=1 Tax=Maribacter sp. X9 TaxID=3402159 RepID=UPI003AF36F22